MSVSIRNGRIVDRGFTLIELLVVVVILGVLSGLVIPVFLIQKESSIEAGIKSDLRNVASTQESYFVDHGRYASTVQLTELRQSPDNELTVVGATSQGYCVQAQHDQAPSVWSYSSSTGMITEGACG